MSKLYYHHFLPFRGPPALRRAKLDTGKYNIAITITKQTLPAWSDPSGNNEKALNHQINCSNIWNFIDDQLPATKFFISV